MLKYQIYEWLHHSKLYSHPTITFREFQKHILPQNQYNFQKISQTFATNEQDVPPSEIITLINSFKDIYKNKIGTSIAFLIPSPQKSPGGYSLIKNITEALNHIGVCAIYIPINQEVNIKLNEYKPKILFAFDFDDVVQMIDWNILKINNTKIGIAAYIDEYKYVSALKQRQKYTDSIGIDYYYSFKDITYIHQHKGYEPIISKKLPIISFPFGANPLHYYPLERPKIKDFIFIGSTNRDKWERYQKWFAPIYCHWANGVLYGPNWDFCTDFEFNAQIERNAYAGTKVGLNLHLENQISYASELNERTYQLALCKIPQLMDNPMLLKYHYPGGGVYSAKNEEEYTQILRHILTNENECIMNAEIAYNHTLNHHTSMHRAVQLIKDLQYHKII
ncbi:MAG: glycosyltransferase [Cytophagales bacterium]|nr:glycosyltransferase [Cytophagales bacterium]